MSNRSSMSIPVSPAGFYIKDAETKAGVGSCIKVGSRHKGSDILLDMGMFNEKLTLSANHVFITHGHIDHIGGCIGHARTKAMSEQIVPTYYVPVETVKLLDAVRVSSSALDGHDIKMNIVPLGPGDSVFLNDSTSIKAFQTIHRVESQGYAIYSHSSPKSSSRSTSNSRRVGGGGGGNNNSSSGDGSSNSSSNSSSSDDDGQLELVYTGDTVFSGLVDLKSSDVDIFNAPILIVEVTYLDGDYQKAVDRGHVHLDDIITNQELFNNQFIVFVHLSLKYFPFSKALTILKEKLEDTMIYDRCYVNLKSFGSSDYLTKLDSVNHNKFKRDVGWGWAASKTPKTLLPPDHFATSSSPGGGERYTNSSAIGGGGGGGGSSFRPVGGSSSGRIISFVDGGNSHNNTNNSNNGNNSFNSNSNSNSNSKGNFKSRESSPSLSSTTMSAPPRPPFALHKAEVDDEESDGHVDTSMSKHSYHGKTGSYKIHCKFWALGTCHQGAKCKFGH